MVENLLLKIGKIVSNWRDLHLGNCTCLIIMPTDK